MVSLYINQRRVGEVMVLDLKGRVRVRGNTVELHKAIRCLLEEGKSQFLLNLSGVTHIDSGGLGELVSCHISAGNRGGVIKLAHLTKQLEELLEITKLQTVFDVYDDEAKALSSFTGQTLRVVEPQPFFV
jgi:anti-sigma B factor antagonist